MAGVAVAMVFVPSWLPAVFVGSNSDPAQRNSNGWSCMQRGVSESVKCLTQDHPADAVWLLVGLLALLLGVCLITVLARKRRCVN